MMGARVVQGFILPYWVRSLMYPKEKSIMGPVVDIHFFAAKDGSRAFVTGEFNDEGLIDDVTGLDLDSYLVT